MCQLIYNHPQKHIDDKHYYSNEQYQTRAFQSYGLDYENAKKPYHKNRAKLHISEMECNQMATCINVG